jgi:hypothetical protein
MAFGWLVNMFRILRGKIEGRLDMASAIIIACARLHNFIIQEDKPFRNTFELVQEEMEEYGITAHKDAPYGMSYLPVVPNEDFEEYEGISYTREAIVQAIHDLEIYRPAHNIARRQQELQQGKMQT